MIYDYCNNIIRFNGPIAQISALQTETFITETSLNLPHSFIESAFVKYFF